MRPLMTTWTTSTDYSMDLLVSFEPGRGDPPDAMNVDVLVTWNTVRWTLSGDVTGTADVILPDAGRIAWLARPLTENAPISFSIQLSPTGDPDPSEIVAVAIEPDSGDMHRSSPALPPG